MTDESPSRAELAAGNVEQLMQQYQAGDAEATAALVERISPQIFQFFLAQVRNRGGAEDLLQDFWLRIHKARHTYRPNEPLLPWMYAIARRVQVDDYRRRSRINRHELVTEELPEPSVASKPASSAWLSISDLLKGLPAAQRETLLLLKVAGLSLEEVARVKGTSVGAVKQKAHRAFETLRKCFGTEI